MAYLRRAVVGIGVMAELVVDAIAELVVDAMAELVVDVMADVVVDVMAELVVDVGTVEKIEGVVELDIFASLDETLEVCELIDTLVFATGGDVADD